MDKMSLNGRRDQRRLGSQLCIKQIRMPSCCSSQERKPPLAYLLSSSALTKRPSHSSSSHADIPDSVNSRPTHHTPVHSHDFPPPLSIASSPSPPIPAQLHSNRTSSKKAKRGAMSGIRARDTMPS